MSGEASHQKEIPPDRVQEPFRTEHIFENDSTHYRPESLTKLCRFGIRPEAFGKLSWGSPKPPAWLVFVSFRRASTSFMELVPIHK